MDKKVVLGLYDFSLNLNSKTLIDNNNVSKKDTFEICEGEIVLFLGTNGSGKTSLIESIIGCSRSGSAPRVSARKMIFNNEEVDLNKVNLLNRIGYSENEIDGSDSNINNIKLKKLINILSIPFIDNKGNNYQKDKNRLNELFNKFYPYDNGIEIIKKKYGKCSSGQKKKFSIIKALIRKDAPLYILDEPMNCLDIQTMLTFMEEINKIKKEQPHSAFLIITHCLIFDKPDKVFKIENGRIINDVANYKKANCLDYLLNK